MAKKQELKKLNNVHKNIMRMRLLGKSKADILKELNVSERNYQVVTSSPLFRAEEQRLQREADELAVRELAYQNTDPIKRRIHLASLDAIEAEAGLIESNDERIKLDTCKHILALGGHTDKQTDVNQQVNVIIKGKNAENVERAIKDIDVEVRENVGKASNQETKRIESG